MNNLRNWLQFIFNIKTEEKPKVEEPAPAPAPKRVFKPAPCGTPGCMCHMPEGRIERW